MFPATSISCAQIVAAASAAKRQFPAYEKILEFYQNVFVAQEQSLLQVRTDAVVIDPSVLAAKLKGGLPLISLAQVPVDLTVSRMLMETLCRIAMTDNPGLAKDAQLLAAAVESQTIDPGALFSGLLNEDDALFQQVSQTLAMNSQALSFFIYNALYPCIRSASDT